MRFAYRLRQGLRFPLSQKIAKPLNVPGNFKHKQTNTDGWPSVPANLKFTRIFHTSRNLVQVRSSETNTGNPAIQTSEVVHPSIVAFNRPWNGYKYWECLTPYPGNAEGQENPSILATNDENLLAWEAPTGVVNPIQPRPSGVLPQGDPGMVYDPVSNSLIIVYIRTFSATGVRQTCLTQSFNGSTWSTPVVIISGTIESSPTLVQFQSGDQQRFRVIYKKVDANPGTMHYREAVGNPMNPSSWGQENNISISVPSGLQVWDFQCWRLQSGEYLFLQTMANSTRVQYSNHFGYSTDGLGSITYLNRPACTSRRTLWPRGLVYTSSIVKTATQSKAVVSGSDGSPTNLWGQETCPLLEHPWHAMSSFPRDVSGQTVLSHGQRSFNYAHSGTGSLSSNPTDGLIVPAGKQLSGSIIPLGEHLVIVQFRVPTDCATVPNNTYVEICNVGGIRVGVKRHNSGVNWLLEIRRADTNAPFWQPAFIIGQPWMRVAFCRDGIEFYAQQNPHPYTLTGDFPSLSHAQTNDISIGSNGNNYGFHIRQIEVMQGAAVQKSNSQRNLELYTTDATDWPQTGIEPRKPEIVTQPGDVTAGAGTSFTCLTAAYPGPTLQWQVNSGLGWVDVAGATGNVYSRNTTGEVGLQVRCICTNSAGSVISKTALVQ